MQLRKERRKRMFFAKGMCLAMILVMSLLIIYGFAIDGVKNTNMHTIEQIKIEKFEAIYTYILDLQNDAYDSARSVSGSIESHMRNLDQEALKNELESGEISETLDDIFCSHASNKVFNDVDNSRNGFIIANTHGILYDSNYKRVSGKDSRTWKSEIKNSYNPKLEKEAINRLLEKSDDLIITESVNFLRDDYGNHTKITTSTYDSLLEVYLKEGIEGFRNYQVLCPAYITNSGDIFGQKDIVSGIKMENNKVIVIQEFNIYDQISHNKPNLMNDDEIQIIAEEHSNSISFLYIIALCFIVFVIVLLIYFSNSYNNYIEKYNLEKDESDTREDQYEEEVP